MNVVLLYMIKLILLYKALVNLENVKKGKPTYKKKWKEASLHSISRKMNFERIILT